MRVFVAVELDERLRQGMAEVAARLKSFGADVRWVPAESQHITLKFLGEVEEPRLEAVRQALRAVACSSSPFSVRLAGLGAFPSLRSPRVIWLGSEGDELAALAEAVERALERLGFAREARRFRGHLTLGRVRSADARLDRLAEQLRQPAARVEIGAFRVEEFHLYRSVLKPTGAEYKKLDTFRLGQSA